MTHVLLRNSGEVPAGAFLHVENATDVLVARVTVDENVVETEVAMQQPRVAVTVEVRMIGQRGQAGVDQTVLDPPVPRRIEHANAARDQIQHDRFESDRPPTAVRPQVTKAVDADAVYRGEQLSQLPDGTPGPEAFVQQHIQRNAGQFLLDAERHAFFLIQDDPLQVQHGRGGYTHGPRGVQCPPFSLEPRVFGMRDPSDQPAIAGRRRVVDLVVLADENPLQRGTTRRVGSRSRGPEFQGATWPALVRQSSSAVCQRSGFGWRTWLYGPSVELPKMVRDFAHGTARH